MFSRKGTDLTMTPAIDLSLLTLSSTKFMIQLESMTYASNNEFSSG